MCNRGPSGAPIPKMYFRCVVVGGAGPFGGLPPTPPFYIKALCLEKGDALSILLALANIHFWLNFLKSLVGPQGRQAWGPTTSATFGCTYIYIL